MKIFRAKTKLIAIVIALSFFAMLVPIAAASGEQSTMPCCAGKAAGHCDSGITPKRVPPPKSEPMCGLDNSEFEDDGITIVAEPSHNESPTSLSQTAETSHAAESIAVSQKCKMDCGACTASSTRQQKRERGILQPVTDRNAPITTRAEFDSQAFSFLSNPGWEQASPRGPPSDLL